MKFFYTAKSSSGKTVAGTINAESHSNAEQKLEKLKFRMITVRRKSSWFDTLKHFEIGRIKYVDIVLFTKHLSVMIRSGLTLDEGIDVLREQTRLPALQKVLNRIYDDVNSGESLSSSMRKFPKIFDTLYVNVIDAGERSGTLDQSLDNLAIQLAKSNELRSKVKAAMAYPLFVLALTFIVGFSLAVFVLPKLIPLFTGLRVELPFFTRLLLNMANFFSANGVWFSVVVVAGILGLIWLTRQKFMQPILSRIVLRMPIVAPIARDVNLAIFNRTLGILLKSGLPIIEALEITAETHRNYLYRTKIIQASGDVRGGKTLAEALERTRHLFPPIVFRMVHVGENTGELDGVLLYLAEFYEAEVDNIAKTLSTIVEPALLAFIGLMVGFVAVAIISPIYQITASIVD